MDKYDEMAKKVYDSIELAFDEDPTLEMVENGGKLIAATIRAAVEEATESCGKHRAKAYGEGNGLGSKKLSQSQIEWLNTEITRAAVDDYYGLPIVEHLLATAKNAKAEAYEEMRRFLDAKLNNVNQ